MPTQRAISNWLPNNTLGLLKSLSTRSCATVKAEKGVAPEKPVEAQSEAPAELSIEDQARAVGWRPEGPESAEIFLAKKPLFEAIKARGKEVKELAATVNELKAHLNKQEAAA